MVNFAIKEGSDANSAMIGTFLTSVPGTDPKNVPIMPLFAFETHLILQKGVGIHETRYLS